jgi:acyl-coenzyme A thioesterase PaaI-like protein
MAGTEASIQAYLWRKLPIYEHVGLTVESAHGGVYRCRVPLNERHRNHFNTVHAAIQWASAEVLGGIVVLANLELDQIFGVVRSVSIEFLRPARTAIVAEACFADAEADELKRELTSSGEAVLELHAVIRDEADTEVARSDAQYLIRKRRPRGAE